MDAEIPSVHLTNSTPVWVRHQPRALGRSPQRGFSKDDGLIHWRLHRSPEEVEPWSKYLAPDHPVVAYCVHGHEVSQGVAAI